MYKNRKIGVVIPAYNEELFIEEVINTMPDFVDSIYVINDCSNDGTLKACIRLSDNRLRIISHITRQGPGAAMLTGYKKACEDNMDIIPIMAGDGQMDPAILDRIIEPVIQYKADYSKGNRLSVPANRRGMPPLRLFGNRLLTYIIGFASGYHHISDPLNGYTAITRDILMKLDLDNIEPGYAFETDLLIKLGAIKANVVNVNMPARYRNEKSKIKYMNFILHVSWITVRDYIWRIRANKISPHFLKNGIQGKSNEREHESC